MKLTPAFEQWFGDSKVVDNAGAPLVVYHGTAKSFNKFSVQLMGKKTAAPDAKAGFFFAENPRAAELFTWESGSPFDGNIMPVYIKLENPLRIDDLVLDGSRLSGSRAGSLMRLAKAEGHDGVIFEKSDMSGHQGRTFAIFQPQQVKSSLGNDGSFDPANPDIRFSLVDQDEENEVITTEAPCP
jgi:hypothetical protein